MWPVLDHASGAAKKGGHNARDNQLISQILGLVTRNGRVDHGPGGHDDMVIAWLLGFWFLTLGQNLSYYGIEPGMVLAEARVNKEETPAERAERYEQIEIRQKIEALAERMANENDEWVSQRLEQQLRALDRRLVLQDDEYYSLDELLQSARLARRTSICSFVNAHRPSSQNGGFGQDAPNDRLVQFGEYASYEA